MTLLIGTDEAGYGPNLGPLVVAASAWRLTTADDHAERLHRAAEEIGARAGIGHPPWADSKQLYKPGLGLLPLERGVLAALLVIDPKDDFPTDGAWLAGRLGIDLPPGTAPAEWPLWTAMTIPVAIAPSPLTQLADAVAATLPRHGVELVALCCRILHPAAFNALLDHGLNKSDILSQTTLGLASDLRGLAADESAVVWCDRHGGRKSYAALVGRHFAAPLVRTLTETPALSAYDIPVAGVRIEFAVGGEARVPVALASMTAKYVRELAMAAFNAHWTSLEPGLRPTAGYPLDARRWHAEAAGAISRAGTPPAALWRRV